MGTQDNKYKQAWRYASAAGFGSAVVLAIIFLFYSATGEVVVMLMTWIPLAAAVLFMAICFVFIVSDIVGWIRKKRVISKSDDTKGIEDVDKQRDREISINININSSDFTDDKMSTKRMQGFHKFVKSISSGGDDNKK